MKNDCVVQQDVSVLYDGACPLCKSYAKMIRLREAGLSLRLINIRQEQQEASRYNLHDYDLNRGMLVVIGDSYYYGSDAMHMLSLISLPNTVISKAFFSLFRSQKRAKILYPFLRFGRFLLLSILRVKPILQKGLHSSK